MPQSHYNPYNHYNRYNPKKCPIQQHQMAFPRKRNAASAETLPATWLELADWGLGASGD